MKNSLSLKALEIEIWKYKLRNMNLTTCITVVVMSAGHNAIECWEDNASIGCCNQM